jgi:hypothetical protein
MWGALAGVVILIEIFIGIWLEAYSQAGPKTILLVTNILTLGIFIYIALRDYKQENSGQISFGRCMFNSILVSALTGIVVAAGSFAYFNFISPAEKEKIIVENERFFVHEKDTTASTVEEYRVNFIKNYKDTVKVTQTDFARIDSMAKDSANVVAAKVDRVRTSFNFSSQFIGYTGQFVIFGLILAALIAAVIANKRA